MRSATINLERLRSCPCGTAFLPHRQSQRFCSRTCAAEARVHTPRPRRTQPAKPPLPAHHRFALRLLDVQPLERRARGGWRFGTRRISDHVVASLIASGRAEIRGEQLFAKPEHGR